MSPLKILQKLQPHFIAIIIFLSVTSFYFVPQIQGKVVEAGDMVSFLAGSKEAREFNEKDSKGTLWTNSMFSGMPTYQIATPSIGNHIVYFRELTHLFIERPIGTFFAGMVMFYLLMVSMGVSHWLSIIGAICFSLNTNSLILFEAGHMTKILTIMYFGLIIAGFLLTFKEKYLVGGILFSLGVSVDLFANHVQMTYYLFMVMAIYGIIEGIRFVKEKKYVKLGKIAGVLAIGVLLGIGTNTARLWSTYEYSKDTMRGDPILVEESNTTPSSSYTEGLEWNYAMSWSNGFLDLFASYIPGVVGGSSAEKLGPESAYGKALIRMGARVGDGVSLPTYWGELPGTSGPSYFGAALVFLFILGLVLVKGPVKWWLGLGVLLTLLLSMGKNFEIFNRLIFDYFPLYNKFRTPNSVLSVTTFLVPILGVLALSDIITRKVSKKEVLRSLKISLGITGGIALFFALLGPSVFDFSYNLDPSHSDAFYAQNYNLDIDILKQDRMSMMRSDGFRSLIIVLLCAGLIWAYTADKLKKHFLLVGIGIIAISDNWLVGKRYLNDSNFVDRKDYEAIFTPRPVDQEILADPDPYYRVFDLSINTFNSSQSSYFHNTIGGYHPAKLQRYQDMIDRHISRGNESVLNMLNTKYLISQDQRVQRMPGALGNAWFVGDIRMVNSPNEEINALNGFNPAEEVIVHTEFSDYVTGINFQKNGTINLTSYAPNKLTYTSNSTGDQLAVFSEIWYGPNKGWKAYIDGQPVDHIRVNYCLRALKIPAGQHNISFEFTPQSFYLGKKIAIGCSSFLLLALLGVIGISFKEMTREAVIEENPVIDSPTKTKKKSKFRTKKK